MNEVIEKTYDLIDELDNNIIIKEILLYKKEITDNKEIQELLSRGNNLEDDYATSYGTEFTMSVENMVRFCNSVYQMYLFFEEDEGMDSVKTLEFNDEYDGSDNIIRIYYCEKDSYMFIQCYYKDPSGNKVDMWEVGILDRNNIVDFIVTLLKFAEDIMEK